MMAVTRPGGRSARVRAEVMAATLRALAEDGYGGLTVDRIADLAGVNKTTIYRRWTDLDGLLTELLADLAARAVPIPDTGDLDLDLHRLAGLIGGVLTDPSIAALVTGLVAAATRSPEAAATLRGFILGRAGAGSVVFTRAAARGDIPADTDPIHAIEALVGPYYLRLLLTGEPLDAALAARTATAVATAARAGAFRPAPSH
ncbi:TetR/AcrR family transcriptional regulator [Catellatospora sp. KI3]|uniref:TetR/AcrR family transcriptional regulator n=1 Tax=Catellatospora sp. KI3 TaxID=3041620 RepID=UPI00248307D7|nr:TetR/AcrR family transcriptional regulator [Catellatospora sp. KI3]MDI1460573.1 TetR/AcrR family transcriptional regulator [Catellatospora sp. KI3]